MKEYRLYQIDSFTDRPFTGNPAGVVPDATGLSDAQMQAIAREMNVSETAFVFPPPPGPDTSKMTVRFFTPTIEVPVCGHATVAAHWVRAYEGAHDGTYTQATKAGDMEILVDRSNGGNRTRIEMTQMPAVFQEPVDDVIKEEIRAALGVPSLSSIGPVQIVSTGHGKVMVPLTSLYLLHGLKPDMARLARVSAQIGCNGFFTFVLADPAEEFTAHGRMFAPAIGIAEDPVTGNACGPLGAYLARHNIIPVTQGATAELAVRQGEAMGRPGTVHVKVDRAGETFRVRIAGEAVLFFATTFQLETSA